MRQPCLTAVVKLYHICQKALSHIWKSFTTIVKKLEYNEKKFLYPYIRIL